MFKASLAFTNIRRQIRKSVIVLTICAVIVGFLCIYTGNIRFNQSRLDSLSEVLPVTARVTNLSGSKTEGLHINGLIPEGIELSGYAEDFICTVQASAGLVREMPPERESYNPGMRVAGTNSIAAYPYVLCDGIDSGFFGGNDAKCIVSKSFLERNGLSVGDTLNLAIYRWAYQLYLSQLCNYEYVADCGLIIADSFELGEAVDSSGAADVIVPVGWVKKFYEENGADFFADSVSFTVKDPRRLNEFKAAMKELGLLSFSPLSDESVAGDALIVNDEMFVRSATGLQSNLVILRMFFPVLLVALLGAGYVVSNLVFQSRREEYAVMRQLGMDKRACLGVYMGESALLALTGGLIGAGAALFFAVVSLSAAALSVILFLAAYMAGSFVSVFTFGRMSVIAMLSNAD